MAADEFAELVLEGASYGIDNYEKVYEPLKTRVKTMPNPITKFSKSRSQDQSGPGDDYDDYDNYPSRSPNVDRRMSRRDNGRGSGGGSRGGDGAGGYVKETLYRESGRAKSAGRDGYIGGGRSRGTGRRNNYSSDSESSVSPPPRRRRETERTNDRDLDDYRYNPADRPRRAQTFADNYSQKGDVAGGVAAGYLASNRPERDQRIAYRPENPSDSTMSTRRDPAWSEPRSSKRSSSTSSSSSSSDSSLVSSSEDERQIKRMKGKEYLSAGLAAVATIHAAHGLISSMEARDKRHMELMKGEITPKEARAKRNKLRLQDAASIGIAALGIKGAYSEWQEVQESRKEIKKQNEERKERHEKRVKRAEKEARKAREAGGRGYGGGDDYRGRDRRDGYRSA